MSQHTFITSNSRGQELTVLMGYDRRLNYVFCVVTGQNDDLVYSNLDDDNAGIHQQDVEYYRPVLENLGLTVPESMFREVKSDQLRCMGNRDVTHGPDQ